jgi:DNA repair protein RadD
MILRPYQSKLVDGCRAALASGKRRIIAYLPTGAGKTAVAAAIIKMVREKNKKVAFICNRVQLIQQTAHVFESLGIPFGVIQGDNTCNPWASVLICSIQTIAKRGLPDVDLLILDECHAVAGTKAYAEIMQGKMAIGLTATPYQKGLGRNHPEMGGPLFEVVVVGADMREMIDQGFLVDADVWAPSDPDLTGVKTVAGDYVEEQLAQAMNKPKLVGDIIQHWFKLTPNKQTMGFFVDIAHSKHVCDEFRSAGVNAVHVDYHMTDDEKREIYRAFKAQEIMILCNCALLSEGADFPAAEVLILGRPTRSKVRFVQMFGRVLRPSPGKQRATILDHSGSTLRLGFPWDFGVMHLDTGKPKDSSSEAKEQDEPLPKACPQCSFMKPPKTPICPQCGFKATRPSDIEPVEGELAQLRGKKMPPALQALESIGRTRVYHQFLWIARERGHKEGWAAMKYKDAFGNWPNGISKEVEEPTPSVLSWEHSQRIKWAKRRKDDGA